MSKFSTPQERELRKVIRNQPSVDESHGCEEFILRYIGFESISRKVWHYYRCRSKNKAESHSGIPLLELKKAFKHFEIDVESNVIEQLLSSKFNKRNSKAARELRNPIIHSWKREDCNEAAQRISDFRDLFNIVILGVNKAIDN